MMVSPAGCSLCDGCTADRKRNIQNRWSKPPRNDGVSQQASRTAAVPGCPQQRVTCSIAASIEGIEVVDRPLRGITGFPVIPPIGLSNDQYDSRPDDLVGGDPRFEADVTGVNALQVYSGLNSILVRVWNHDPTLPARRKNHGRNVHVPFGLDMPEEPLPDRSAI
jgi:hypothetical protein